MTLNGVICTTMIVKSVKAKMNVSNYVNTGIFVNLHVMKIEEGAVRMKKVYKMQSC